MTLTLKSTPMVAAYNTSYMHQLVHEQEDIPLERGEPRTRGESARTRGLIGREERLVGEAQEERRLADRGCACERGLISGEGGGRRGGGASQWLLVDRECASAALCPVLLVLMLPLTRRALLQPRPCSLAESTHPPRHAPPPRGERHAPMTRSLRVVGGSDMVPNDGWLVGVAAE